MVKRCEIEGCESTIVGQGLCRKHYMRKLRKGSTDDARKNARGTCAKDGCERPHQALGLCYSHWRSRKRKEHVLQAKLADPRACGYCGTTVDPAKKRRGEVSYCSRTCKEKAWIAAGKNATSVRKAYFKRRYGLTLEQVEAMAEAGCSICGTVEWNGRHARPHVDHCHKSGRVRGILCSECNTGLGKFKDDPALLRRAAAYLESG